MSASQAAITFVPSGAKLSERLAVLAQPVNVALQASERAQAVGLPAHSVGSLLLNAEGALLVDIRATDSTPATLAALTAADAQITHVAPAYRTITAFVAPDQLSALASIDAVENVQEELRPQVGTLAQTKPVARRLNQADCPSATTSEGDAQLKADLARATFGVDGTGVTVGVFSDSYNQNASAPTSAQTDIASGDLPGSGNPCNRVTPVSVVAESQDTEATDEGRAMLQIVHDLAPGANLAFATATGGLFRFADTIRALHSATEASVMVDDVSYFAEPFFQEGPIDLAIEDAVGQGVLYFTSAGNANVRSDDNLPLDAFSSYEAVYRPVACPTLTFPNGTKVKPGKDCHTFNPRGSDPTFGITLDPGGSFQAIMQWAEPWYGVTDNLDIYVIDQNNQILSVVGGRNKNAGANGTQIPFETVAYGNTRGTAQRVQLLVARVEGSLAPVFKTVLVQANGVTAQEYGPANSSDIFGPTIIGHAASPAAITVGAVAFNNASAPEAYSSRGPAVAYFEPVASTTPALPLSPPAVRTKPEIAATDGGSTTFFGSASSGYRFFGTSAAAPHAAAVGALMQQRAGERGVPLTSGFARSVLQRTASAIPNGTPQANGSGLIDALGALSAVDRLQIRSVLLPQIVRP